MAAARVILVSDTHLSGSAPQAQANWDAAQWSWLEEQIGRHRGQSVALITHKPVTDRTGVGCRTALPVLAAVGPRPARPAARRPR